MVSRRSLIASGLIALLLSSCAKQLTSREVAEHVGKSVVLITYADAPGNGSGFFVRGRNKVCTVLTAHHVVAPSSQLKLQTNDGKFWNSETIQRFPNQDLALITFEPDSEKCPYKALKFGNSDRVKVGDDIYITGFPSGSSPPRVGIFDGTAYSTHATPDNMTSDGTSISYSAGPSKNYIVSSTVSALDKLADGYGISYHLTTYDVCRMSGPVVKARMVPGVSFPPPIWSACGMTGGPVVNTAGKVIAIHGRSERELVKKAELTNGMLSQKQPGYVLNSYDRNSYKWSIPINVYLANKNNIPSESVATSDAPKTAEEWLKVGTELFLSQRYEKAIDAYDKAIQFKPDYHEAWYGRGLALGNLKQYEKAIASYDKAIQFKPDYHEAWYDRGIALGSWKQYEKAIASYDKAIEFKPDYHEAWYDRGIALENLKQYEKAIASYDKAIEFKPDYHEAWYDRGIALGNLKQYEKAIASYDKAIEFKPDYHEAWYSRGIALGNLKQYEAAKKAYDKAVKLKSDYHEAWTGRGVALWNLKQYEAARGSFSRGIYLKPDYQPEAPKTAQEWLKVGNDLFVAQRYEKAIDAYDLAIQYKHDLDEAWYRRGMALGKLKQYEQAIASYNEVSPLSNPYYPEVLYNRGMALESLKQYKKAIASYDEAIQIYQYQKVRASYDKAIQISPYYPEVLYKRGMALESLKQYKKALESYNKAIQLKPNYQLAISNRKKLLTQMGRSK
ncbi:tetratricopeptide repeat protein [Cyanobacteria bacterium FACHB-472]|nr:tetratricopeptide repeat protein [Cyanobacteria bacterium FACHB-472]